MFAGKGGVGKTTCAGAAALHRALRGEKTLIISTDPTPSLSHIFEIKEKQKPVKVLDNLYLAELGIDEIQADVGQEVRAGSFHEVFSSIVSVGRMMLLWILSPSILPGLGRRIYCGLYQKELSISDEYQRIVWDTAPLGQTLDLLETPTILRTDLNQRPDLLAAQTWQPIQAFDHRDFEGLGKHLRKRIWSSCDGRYDFTLVTIAEALAIEQLDGILTKLDRFGFKMQAIGGRMMFSKKSVIRHS